MMHKVSIAAVIVFSISTAVWGETIPCPDMGYDLVEGKGYRTGGPPGTIYHDERKTITYNDATCTYDKKNELHLTWVSYYDHQVHNYPDCRWNKFLGGDSERGYEVRKKQHKVSITSRTHLASVHLTLSRKEFRESNRKKWTDAAEALLERYKVRGLPCDQATGEWAEFPGESVPASPRASGITEKPRAVSPAAPSKQTAPAGDVDGQIEDIINRLKSE